MGYPEQPHEYTETDPDAAVFEQLKYLALTGEELYREETKDGGTISITRGNKGHTYEIVYDKNKEITKITEKDGANKPIRFIGGGENNAAANKMIDAMNEALNKSQNKYNN